MPIIHCLKKQLNNTFPKFPKHFLQIWFFLRGLVGNAGGRWTVVLHDLGDLLQPWSFYDSVILCFLNFKCFVVLWMTKETTFHSIFSYYIFYYTWRLGSKRPPSFTCFIPVIILMFVFLFSIYKPSGLFYFIFSIFFKAGGNCWIHIFQNQ